MHSFDHPRLERYLARHVAGFTTLDGVQKFDAGQSNPTYRLTSGARSFVLRAKPMGELLKSAHQVDREFRVMQALQSSPVPVPKMYHLSTDDNPLGAQFFVMDYVEGQIHWDPSLPDQSAQSRGKIYDQMNKVLADLHDVDPAHIGLTDFGKPGNYYGRQIARWSAQYKASETTTRPTVHNVIPWLEAHIPAEDGQVAITHGDFRIDNMIFRDGHVVALLDWELSTLGHPLADLAYQMMMWRLPNSGAFKGLGGVDRATAGLPQDADYVAAYCARRQIKTPDNWAFYSAFASFRFLAILQGVMKRGQDGTASNPLAPEQMEEAIAMLAEDAAAAADL